MNIRKLILIMLLGGIYLISILNAQENQNSKKLDQFSKIETEKKQAANVIEWFTDLEIGLEFNESKITGVSLKNSGNSVTKQEGTDLTGFAKGIGLSSEIKIIKLNPFSIGIEGFISTISCAFLNEKKEKLLELKGLKGIRFNVGYNLSEKHYVAVVSQLSDYSFDYAKTINPIVNETSSKRIASFGVEYKYYYNENICLRYEVVSGTDLFTQQLGTITNEYKILKSSSVAFNYHF